MTINTLRFLVIATAILFMSAGVTVWLQSHGSHQSTTMDQPAFPTLKQSLDALDSIEIKTGNGTTSLKRQNQSWVLPDKGNYPADISKIRDLIARMASMTLVEEKTADPARYAALSLDEPHDKTSGARVVRLLDNVGKPLVAVVFGRSAPSLGRQGGGTYIRQPDQPQTYLATGLIDIPDTEMGWIDRTLFPVKDEAMIKSVTLAESGSSIVTLTRDKPDDETYKITPPPAGKLDQGKVARLADVPVSLVFDDVRPLAPTDKPGRQAVFTGFDGMIYKMTIVSAGKDVWVKAEEAGPNAEAVKAFNALHGAYVYLIPAYRKDSLWAQPADFVAPPPDAKTRAVSAPVSHGKRS